MQLVELMLVILVLVPIGRAVARYVTAKTERLSDAPAPAAPEELQDLQEQVERLGERVARLTEQQRFLTRLLESPPSQEADATTEESKR